MNENMRWKFSHHKQMIRTVVFTIVLVLFTGLAVRLAFAQSPLGGLNSTANTAFDGQIPFKDQGTTAGFAAMIGKIIGIVLSFVGVFFMLLMIYAGFTWMLARGNESEVTKAKEIMTGAIIGLIIVMSAYAITTFIGTELTPTQ